MKVKIGGHRDHVSIEVFGYENMHAKNLDDANWLSSYVAINVSAFSGEYEASFNTTDFVDFLNQLTAILQAGVGRACFEVLEDTLQINIDLDTNGKVRIDGFARTLDALRTVLSFEFDSDQSYVRQMCSELASISRAFPPVTENLPGN